MCNTPQASELSAFEACMQEYFDLTLEQYACQYIPPLQLFWIVLGRLYYILATRYKGWLLRYDLYDFVVTKFMDLGFPTPQTLAPADYPGDPPG